MGQGINGLKGIGSIVFGQSSYVIAHFIPFPQLAPAAKFCTQQSNWVNLSRFVYIMVEMFAMKGDTDYPAKNSLVAGYLAVAMIKVQDRSMSLCCECVSLPRNSIGVVKMSSSATSAVHYRLFLRAT